MGLISVQPCLFDVLNSCSFKGFSFKGRGTKRMEKLGVIKSNHVQISPGRITIGFRFGDGLDTTIQIQSHPSQPGLN
jgi:hypothetical protein